MKSTVFVYFEKFCCKYKIITNLINDILLLYDWLKQKIDLKKGKNSKECNDCHDIQIISL